MASSFSFICTQNVFLQSCMRQVAHCTFSIQIEFFHFTNTGVSLNAHKFTHAFLLVNVGALNETWDRNKEDFFKLVLFFFCYLSVITTDFLLTERIVLPVEHKKGKNQMCDLYF